MPLVVRDSVFVFQKTLDGRTIEGCVTPGLGEAAADDQPPVLLGTDRGSCERQMRSRPGLR